MTRRRLLTIAAGTAAALLLGLAGLVVHVVGLSTLRFIDREVLVSLPAGIVALSRPAASVAERAEADGPLRYEERLIPGAAGDPPVRIVMVEPRAAVAGRPGILDLHGGGFTHGSPEWSLTMLAEDLASKLGATVVSVDYRLAPGTRYPGSLRDNDAALRWFAANAPALGIDPRRIGVVGFSAGGAHAATLSLHARDHGGPPILFQVLLAPALDDRTGSTVDPDAAVGLFPWTRAQNRAAWAALLGVEPGSDAVPSAAVPMRAADLSGLPPTYIGIGSLDLFVAESRTFAQRLRAAGVPVELSVFEGGVHGFEVLAPSARISRGAREDLEQYLRQKFSGS